MKPSMPQPAPVSAQCWMPVSQRDFLGPEIAGSVIEITRTSRPSVDVPHVCTMQLRDRRARASQAVSRSLEYGYWYETQAGSASNSCSTTTILPPATSGSSCTDFRGMRRHDSPSGLQTGKSGFA